MTSAYAEDESAADKQYKGKPLEVTGIIESLVLTEKGNRGVSLKGGKTRYMSSVLCTLTDGQRDKFEALKEGQLITVEGTCDGFFMGMVVNLGNCSIK